MERLICLPEDVVVDIVTGWLGLPDVTRMDIAVCFGAQKPSQRRTWLNRLYSNAIYNASHAVDDFNPRTADRFTEWLYARNIRVTTMCVSRIFVTQHERRDSYLETCGKCITTFAIGKRDYGVRLPMSSLCKFCPNVTNLIGPNFFQLSDYETVSMMWPDLRTLNLEYCNCEPGILLLLQRCRKLQHIKINLPVWDETKRKVVQALPNTMMTLDLSGVWEWDIDWWENPSTWYSLLPELDFPHLQSLCRDASSRFTEHELLTVVQRCPLKILHIKPRDGISDTTLHALPDYCQHVQEISIYQSGRISEEALAALFQGCARTLRKVDYEGTISSTLLLHTFGAYCARLEELTVRTCRSSLGHSGWVEGWRAVAQGCARLTTLSAEGCVMTDDAVCALAEGCTGLCSIRIEGRAQENALTDKAMYAIGQFCAKLRSLQQIGCTEVTDTGLCAIATGCPLLRSVRLSGTACGDALLEELGEHCRDLCVLQVTKSQFWGNKVAPLVTDAGVTALVTRFGKLRELNIESELITAAVVPIIAEHCKFLRELRLSLHMKHPEETAARALFDRDVQVSLDR